MSIEIRVPTLPESVSDATVLAWHKQPGESVGRDEHLVDLETDKVVLEVVAPSDGALAEIRAETGAVVKADDLLGLIGEAAQAQEPDNAMPITEKTEQAKPASEDEPVLTPAVRSLIKSLNIDPRQIEGTGKDGRIVKADVMRYLDSRDATSVEQSPEVQATPAAPAAPDDEALLVDERPEQRVAMTRLRARIAERLVEAQQTAAILTTFNEVDLTAVGELRKRHQESFEKQHGVRLGYMSFFAKAVIEALRRFPVLNASVDGDDIVYHGYYDIGVAVGSPRGLVVPVLRDVDKMSFGEVEEAIRAFGKKAQDGTLSYEDLTGGTFTISNGGVFGSMLSTPILNPPQSGILGMHKIQQRPMAVDGKVEIRPMMYLALSYDHRVIDGREAVQFLVAVKDALEDPARLLLQI